MGITKMMTNPVLLTKTASQCFLQHRDSASIRSNDLITRNENRSAISERVAQGNARQFNSLDFYSCGSGPGGQEDGGSNPLAPTNSIGNQQLAR